MPNVAMIDRGDYWDVIGDYSGSRRHAAMNESQWKAEFQLPAYATMRQSHPGILAAVAPVGVGKWKKDWSGRYVPLT